VDSQALSKPISPVVLLSKEPLSHCVVFHPRVREHPSITEYNELAGRAIPARTSLFTVRAASSALA
jgi:hypothetical protein